jgi:hypothetical protein
MKHKQDGMNDSVPGKLVVGAMFLLAAILGGYAWWHHLHVNSRCRQFWGSEAMQAIEYADSIEFLALVPRGDPPPTPGADGESLVIFGREYLVQQRADIRHAAGLVHARHALLVDENFRWHTPGIDCQPAWNFGLRFTKDTYQTTVVFNGQCDQLWWVEGRRPATMVPQLANALRKKHGAWQAIASANRK